MHDEVMYRCVNMSCARSLPRRVNYCPYCGINQSTALPRPLPASSFAGDDGAAVQQAAAAASAAAFAAASAAHASTAAAAAAALDGRAARTTSAPAMAGVIDSAPAQAAGKAAPRAASPGVTAAPPTPAAPPRRQPVRLRWWLLALGALWLIWYTQRPSSAHLDTRVDKAVALASACKANEAQAELIALKRAKASDAQLARLQTALDDADGACRRASRGKTPARGATRGAVQAAASAPSSSSSQSVRNLLGDARAAIARGDHRGAADKMEVCVTMVDANTRDCSALKARAERLDVARRSCLGIGGEWAGEDCR